MLTFDEAYAQLEQIIQKIESDKVPLDELAAQVKQAKTLIKFCETKLRDIQHELEDEPPGEEDDDHA
ncbi:MAG TPA: exodeoxyribonuclease VII small subunit [Phnomibacter sp.]|nr:exodeoxyribonuclease VII small subunit [Phnomibacter sp.]